MEFLIALVVLVALAAAIAMGFLPGSVPQNTRDVPPTNIPAGDSRWAPSDVTGLRFAVVTRGYQMEQVDEALLALAEQLRRRDDDIERLTAAAQTERTAGGSLPGHSEAEQTKYGDPTVTNGSLPKNAVSDDSTTHPRPAESKGASLGAAGGTAVTAKGADTSASRSQGPVAETGDGPTEPAGAHAPQPQADAPQPRPDAPQPRPDAPQPQGDDDDR